MTCCQFFQITEVEITVDKMSLFKVTVDKMFVDEMPVDKMTCCQFFQGLVDYRGDSAIYWAARQGHEEIIQYLVSQGVHINQQNKVRNFDSFFREY